MVIKADKGNCTVVMNKTDYDNQIRAMLQDRDVYQPITDKRRNPTSRTESTLQKKLLDLKKQGNLTESEYWRLRPSESTPAAFYGLPKIHKVKLEPKEDHFTLPKEATPQVPLRPINSCIGSPTYQLSKYLASILKSLQSESDFPVKNAKEFTNFISSQVVAEDEQIVSFDVVSLFTSIPVDLAIDIVQRKLGETTEWKALTSLTQAQVLDLLSFVLNNSYFSSEGTQYHQVFGCAMGSPVSAVIAELVMEEIEEKALASAPVKPRWWRRYVDDSNACLKSESIRVFHSHLNSINPHIQFTIEMPTTGAEGQTIAFLDTSNTVSASGQVEVGVYRKPTHTNKYLAFESHSPAQSKRAVVKTLMDRAKYLPSTSERKQSEKQQVIGDLKVNGYPQSFIDRCLVPAQETIQPENQESQESPRGYASIPYIKGVSERVRRVLSRENVRTTFKPVKTLGSIFKKPKDRPATNQIKGIVYKVKCKTCDFAYVGESKRSWNSRGAEHKPGTRSNNESAIRFHAETTDHDIHPDYVEILERNVNNRKQRLFLEALHSIQDINCVNEHVQFPQVYLTLGTSLETSGV